MNKRVKGKKERERESKQRAMDICNTYIRQTKGPNLEYIKSLGKQ